MNETLIRIALNGRPETAFLIFLLLEACVFIAVALHLRMLNGWQRP